jgi:hypothetical protein
VIFNSSQRPPTATAGFSVSGRATVNSWSFIGPTCLQEGHETETAVADFLNARPFGPEREALLQVLGVGDDTGDDTQENYTTTSQ